MKKRFSVIIPARDEERLMARCVSSIWEAAEFYKGQVEVIVVVNRCRDNTAAIARHNGAIVVEEEARNLSRIRNTGVRHASGEIILTIDADSKVSRNVFLEIDRHIKTGTCIGGALFIRMERLSLGILLTMLMCLPFLLWFRISGGCFWLKKSDFERMGGFNENYVTFEDVEFARRLKAFGKRQRKRFKVLFNASITTSSRKFDQIGDWYIVKRPWMILELLKGDNRELANRFWYDANRP